LLLFGFGNPDLQHAAIDMRLHHGGVNSIGQRERPREAAEGALEPVVPLALLVVLGLTLAREGEHPVLELDVDVVVAEAR
jgi:hypothetical protein